MNKNQIRGMFLGTGIGDGLGMAVETFSPEKITEKYGVERVTEYLVPTGHKWFDGRKAGTTTDDAQLTLAVAEGLIENGFDMETQARKHVEAYQASTAGWGGTTRAAVRNLLNGATWDKSGVEGRGNGVAMKIAPAVAYMAGLTEQYPELKIASLQAGMTFIRNLTIMTHATEMAVCSTAGLVAAFYKCLKGDICTPGYILAFAEKAKQWHNFGVDGDDVVERFKLLSKHEEYDTARLIAEFGGGSCYAYNSVPFSLMFFLNGPETIETLYDVVSAGGDADTNGAIVGALLGALNGEEIFPQHLIDGLDQADKILEVADRFCDKLEVSDV